MQGEWKQDRSIPIWTKSVTIAVHDFMTQSLQNVLRYGTTHSRRAGDRPAGISKTPGAGCSMSANRLVSLNHGKLWRRAATPRMDNADRRGCLESGAIPRQQRRHIYGTLRSAGALG